MLAILCRCICLCKDTNFKANHNLYWHLSHCFVVVYAYAKILILKQITTSLPRNFPCFLVVYAYAKILILKQITTVCMKNKSFMCCICLCKDTNFKANHNFLSGFFLVLLVVYAYAKILILKQITTCISSTSLTVLVVYAYAKILILKQITTITFTFKISNELYMPMQRY